MNFNEETPLGEVRVALKAISPIKRSNYATNKMTSHFEGKSSAIIYDGTLSRNKKKNTPMAYKTKSRRFTACHDDKENAYNPEFAAFTPRRWGQTKGNIAKPRRTTALRGIGGLKISSTTKFSRGNRSPIHSIATSTMFRSLSGKGIEAEDDELVRIHNELTEADGFSRKSSISAVVSGRANPAIPTEYNHCEWFLNEGKVTISTVLSSQHME